MNFQLSSKINPENIFLVNKSQLEGRFEPGYYTPTFRKLENVVRKQSTHKLRHFIKNIAGGATPSTTKKNKYYSNKVDGFPFLRVQNLQTNCQLNFDNLKYINEETHKGLLKRSQVDSGDLLIKITGVGRMAIASVAPEEFQGNTNQHMVVIKTSNRKISEYLANYLNLDIIEILASRRATGATRPALDYQALKSIPIIEGIDFDIIEEAYKKKAQKETEAEKLLNSIDDYLLSELGIKLPEKDGRLESRMFETSFQNVSGIRSDPFYFLPFFRKNIENISDGKYELKQIRNLTNFIESGSRPKGGVSNISDGVWSIGGEHIDDKCNVGIGTPKYIPEDFHRKKLLTETKMHDIILVKDGATTGKMGIITDQSLVNQNVNEHVFLIRLNKSALNPFYFTYYLHSHAGQKQIKRQITGATVTGLTKEAVRKIYIPTPPIETQNEIANHISHLRNQAKQLKQEARQGVANARQKVENMILAE